MRRPIVLVLLAAAIGGGGYYFHQHYRFEGIDHFAVRRRDAPAPQFHPDPESPGGAAADTIRIGSFDIQRFDTAKASNPRIMDIIVQVIRGFDVVAIQEICTKDETMLPRFVEQINSAGAHYDYVVGPRLGHAASAEQQQYAFVFNTETIEVDRSATFTVADPQELLERPPLVGMFRCRGPAPDKAFTFRLIDVRTEARKTGAELKVLRDVYHAVLNDGRNEDDVILLGNLNASETELGELGHISGITWALSNTLTNTKRTASYDNMLFLARETNEFTGRAGAIDLVRRFNITTDQALEVSDHLPIWAEFSIYEGGNRGRVAGLPETRTKK